MATLQLLSRAAARTAPWAVVGMILMACGRDGNATPRAAAGSGSASAGGGANDSSGDSRLGQMLDEIDQAQDGAAQHAAAGDAASGAGKGGTGKPKEKVTYIPGGQPVDITQYAVAGETTIFDFYSEYCGPCRQISPFLDRLDQARSDISVVRVDINRPGVRGIDWGSPVARQYGLDSVPHFKIYGPDGKLVSEGRPAYSQVVGWIQQLEG